MTADVRIVVGACAFVAAAALAGVGLLAWLDADAPPLPGVAAPPEVPVVGASRYAVRRAPNDLRADLAVYEWASPTTGELCTFVTNGSAGGLHCKGPGE